MRVHVCVLTAGQLTNVIHAQMKPEGIDDGVPMVGTKSETGTVHVVCFIYSSFQQFLFRIFLILKTLLLLMF